MCYPELNESQYEVNQSYVPTSQKIERVEKENETLWFKEQLTNFIVFSTPSTQSCQQTFVAVKEM